MRHSNGFIILDITPEDLIYYISRNYNEYAFIGDRRSQVALYMTDRNMISIGFYDDKEEVYFTCRYL